MNEGFHLEENLLMSSYRSPDKKAYTHRFLMYLKPFTDRTENISLGDLLLLKKEQEALEAKQMTSSKAD